MKASLQSVRIAPKKANLIAKMVRGMSVPDAVESLRRTHKKAARMIEQLLRYAMANASHNDKQDAQTMVIKSIVVNQGTAYRRGMPMARGRMRPYRKFLSHITVELGFPDDKKRSTASKGPAKKTQATASQKAKTPVPSTAIKAERSSDSPASSVSSK